MIESGGLANTFFLRIPRLKMRRFYHIIYKGLSFRNANKRSNFRNANVGGLAAKSEAKGVRMKLAGLNSFPFSPSIDIEHDVDIAAYVNESNSGRPPFTHVFDLHTVSNFMVWRRARRWGGRIGLSMGINVVLRQTR